MPVSEATEHWKGSWDTLVASAPTGSFLQSWAWGEFQRAAGFAITRLAVTATGNGEERTGNLRAVCLLVHRPLPLGRWYLYAPWGPVLRGLGSTSAGTPEDPAAALGTLTAALKERLRGPPVFARLEPKFAAHAVATALLRAQGYLVTGRGIQPRDTVVVDLTPSEDELLIRMHPKLRYNIRLARRQGVRVEAATNAAGLAVFLRLAAAVEKRGAFHYHPERYYAAMLRTLAPAGMLQILVARHQGLPLAVHLLVRFGDTVTYAHGASGEARKHVMAPHLLQWEGILRAKAAGAVRYDLFGIAPPGSGPAHPWFGITRFKRSFGGTEEHYLGAADLVGDGAFYRAYEVGRALRGLVK